MDDASIGDGVRTVYEFDWGNNCRTTDEIGDLSILDCDCTIDEIVDVARADNECDVSVVGFEEV
jgi:hypothetical protein